VDIVSRVKNILLQPVKEWGVIDGESASVNSLYTNYAILLALIPAVAGFIGNSLIGFSMMGMTIRTPIVAGLVLAIMSYVIGLAMLYVVALIINALAPQFNGKLDLVQALKVAVYSATPVWVASILLIIPVLGVLVLLAAIYSLVLFWLGAPRLMRVPEDKKVVFNIVVIVCAVVVSVVLFGIVNAISGALGLGPAAMMR
jgi:hypothetical protein